MILTDTDKNIVSKVRKHIAKKFDYNITSHVCENLEEGEKPFMSTNLTILEERSQKCSDEEFCIEVGVNNKETVCEYLSKRFEFEVWPINVGGEEPTFSISDFKIKS